MKKLLNYVKSGKGCGILWLLVFVLLISVVIGGSVKIMGDDFAPTLQNVADKLLPIKIENGVIVEPDNTVKSVALEVNDQVIIPIVLDTTVDTIDTSNLQPGFYISKKALYGVGTGETRIVNFTQNMDLPSADYTDLFKKFATYTAIVGAVTMFGAMALVYLLIVAFCALCSQLMTKIMKNTWEFAPLMRLNTLTFIASSLVLFVVAIFGYNSSFTVTVIATLLLDYIVIKNINEESAKTKE